MSEIRSSQPMQPYPTQVSPLNDLQGNDPIAMPSAIYGADTAIKASKYVKSNGLSTIGVKELFSDKTKFSQVLDTGAKVLNNTKEVNKHPGVISSLLSNIPGAKQLGDWVGKLNPFKPGGAGVGASNVTAATTQATTAVSTASTATTTAASSGAQLLLPSSELRALGNTAQNANQLSQAANAGTTTAQVASTTAQTAGKGFLSGLGQAMKSNVITSALFAVVGNGVELMTGKQNMTQFVGLTALDTAAFAGIGVAAGAVVAGLTLPAWGSVLAAGALAFGAAKVYEGVVRKPAKAALGAVGGGVPANTQTQQQQQTSQTQGSSTQLPAPLAPTATQQTTQVPVAQTPTPMTNTQVASTAQTPSVSVEDNTPNLPQTATATQQTPAPVVYQTLPQALQPQSQPQTVLSPMTSSTPTAAPVAQTTTPAATSTAADPMAAQQMMAEVDAYLETL